MDALSVLPYMYIERNIDYYGSYVEFLRLELQYWLTGISIVFSVG